MKKYLFGLIIRSVLVLIMLSLFFMKQDSRIIKTITFYSVLLIWILLSLVFKHPQTAEWDKTRDTVGKALLSIFLHLFPFCFLFINIYGSLVLFELPDKLLVYFSKGNSDIVLNILNATFWGNAALLIWNYGSLSITCVILFLFLKWVKNYLSAEQGLQGMRVTFGGILAMSIISVGVTAIFVISFSVMEHSFGVADRYYKDIRYYQTGTLEEYSGLVLVGHLEELESAFYEKQPQPFHLLIGYYPIQPEVRDRENITLYCPVELLRNIEVLEKTNYTVQYLPNTYIVTSISLAEEP